MSKLGNAADRLDFYLAAERKMPFEWGRRNGDCLLFLLGWAEQLGYASETIWRCAYEDEKGARQILAAFGGAPAAVLSVIGRSWTCAANSAARGDLGLMAVDGWFLGMICTGRYWVLRAGEGGLRYTRARPDLLWNMDFTQ